MHVLSLSLRVLYYLIMGYGVYVCWSAFRISRKSAWLLVGSFCFSAFLYLGVRQIGIAVYGAPKKRQEEHVTTVDGRRVPVKTTTLSLPIFPFLLVAGLASLARDQAGDTVQP
ncbi:MAG: hypothetical protein HN849_11180 [Victivallales bacterium]|jgi:hypothetical protein|nr:hypothetical protein [Victivallales bacterium]MBT7300070.1 hypothetical protein [Victivallales bacterium]